MDIFVLCLLSFALTLLAWVYLNFQEQGVEITSTENSTGDVAESSNKRFAFLKPSLRRMIFLVIMITSLIGVAVALELVYSSNTLVDNIKLIFLLSVLFVAANVDARQQIIPNALVLFGLVSRVVFWIIEIFVDYERFWTLFKDNLLACLIAVFFFVVGVLLIKSGIGIGDIKLMLVMCLFQGFYGVISSLFFSLFVAFVYAIFLLLLKRKGKKDSVAFAPSILVGTMASIIMTGM